MSVTNTQAFAYGNWGAVAQQYSQTLDAGGDDEVLLALMFGTPSSVSSTNYTWLEFVEGDSTPLSAGGGTAIDYSSGRITLPDGYTRNVSAAASEVFRITSFLDVILALKAFRVATGTSRYIAARLNRAAATNTIPMAGAWTYGLPLTAEANMAFTYDVTTDIGKVRMLITDRNEARPIFQDAEIQAYLDLEDSSVRRAAAAALETMASDQALVLKVIVTLDLETDGAKVSDALMKRAAVLRQTENETGAFDIAEMITNDFGDREWFAGAIRRGE